MRRKAEITAIKQAAQNCREKQIDLDNLMQPHQVKIAQLVDDIDKKVTELKASHGVVDSTEDPLVTQIMLTTAQEEVTRMDHSLAKLKETFRKTAQEATDKLAQKKLVAGAGDSGTSHK